SGVTVLYEVGGSVRTVRARTAIVATPAPIARRIVADLPAWKAEALGRVRYAPFVVAGIFTRESQPMPWAVLYAVAVPDASFCSFFNPPSAVRTAARREPGGSIVMYASGERGRALLDEADTTIAERYVRDANRLFPGLDRVVDQVTVAKWE